MRVLLPAVLALMAPCIAVAGHYRGATLARDGTALVLHTDRGDIAAPRTDADQQGFDAPRVSPDGRTAGWLVLESNCCTSYPLPTSLVLFRDGAVLHRFGEGMAIWAWAFDAGGQAVAYRQRAPHGASTIVYTLRRVADGRLLGEFDCLPREDTPEGQPVPYAYEGKVPDWVWPIAEECPSR
jgi:hypothetical protein